MIILIVGQEDGRVSHGVDTVTLENVVLPDVYPASIGRYDHSMGEWILKEEVKS